MSKTPFDCLIQLRKATVFKKCPTLSVLKELVDCVNILAKFTEDGLEFIDDGFTPILSVPTREVIITLYNWDLNMLKIISQTKALEPEYMFFWKLLSAICSYKDVRYILPPLQRATCETILGEYMRQLELLDSDCSNVDKQSYVSTMFNAVFVSMNVPNSLLVGIHQHSYSTTKYLTHQCTVDLYVKYINWVFQFLKKATVTKETLVEARGSLRYSLLLNSLMMFYSCWMEEVNDKLTQDTNMKAFCSLFKTSYSFLTQLHLYIQSFESDQQDSLLPLFRAYLDVFDRLTEYCLFPSCIASSIQSASLYSRVFSQYYDDLTLSSKFKRLNEKKTETSSAANEVDFQEEESVSPQSPLSPFYTVLRDLLWDPLSCPSIYPLVESVVRLSISMDNSVSSSLRTHDALPLKPSLIFMLELSDIIINSIKITKDATMKCISERLNCYSLDYYFTCLSLLFTTFTKHASLTPSVEPIMNHILLDVYKYVYQRMKEYKNNYYIFVCSIHIFQSIFIMDISILTSVLTDILKLLFTPPMTSANKQDQEHYVPQYPSLISTLPVALPLPTTNVPEAFLQFIIEKYNIMRSLPQLFSSLLTILETSSIPYSVLTSYILTPTLSETLSSQFLTLLPGQIPTIWDILSKYIFSEVALCRYVSIYIFNAFEKGITINNTISVNIKQKLIFTKKSVGNVLYDLIKKKTYSDHDIFMYMSFSLSLLYFQDKIELYVPAISPYVIPVIPLFTQLYADKYTGSNANALRASMFYDTKEENDLKVNQFEELLKTLITVPGGEILYISIYLERLQYLRKVYNKIENQGNSSLSSVYEEIQRICEIINSNIMTYKCIPPSIISLLYSSLPIVITYMPSSAISSLLSHVLQPCEHIQKNQPCGNLSFLSSSCLYEIPTIRDLFGSVFNSDYQKAIQQYKKDKSDSNYRVICHYVSLFKAIPSGYWTDDIMIQFLNHSLYHYIKKNEELPGLFSNLFQFISVLHSDLLSRYITTLFKEKEKYINTFFALLNSETLSNLAVYHVDQLLHDQGEEPSEIDVYMKYFFTNLQEISKLSFGKARESSSAILDGVTSYMYSFCRELIYLSSESNIGAINGVKESPVFIPLLFTMFYPIIEEYHLSKTLSFYPLFITVLLLFNTKDYAYSDFYQKDTYGSYIRCKQDNDFEGLISLIGLSTESLLGYLTDIVRQPVDESLCNLFIHLFYLLISISTILPEDLYESIFSKYIDVYSYVSAHRTIHQNDSPFDMYNEFVAGITYFIKRGNKDVYSHFIAILNKNFCENPSTISLLTLLFSNLPNSEKYICMNSSETFIHKILISYTQSYQIDCLEFISLLLKDYSFDIKSNHLSIIYSYITKLLLDADGLKTNYQLDLSLISSVLTVLSSCLSLSSMYISHSLYIIINILTTLFTILMSRTVNDQNQKLYDLCIYKYKLVTENLQLNKKLFRHYIIYLLYDVFSYVVSTNMMMIPQAFTPILYDLFDLLSKNEFQQLYAQLNPTSQDIYKKYYNNYKNLHQYRGQV